MAPFPERCDYCSAPFEEGIRYPTTTVDGDLRIYTFCDETCKGDWLDEHGGATTETG
ncbi:DUF7576 family protein [Halomicrococcus gelatinilyticus]|uniref:DUF7576 family protein n=1 Tax=Halomicrococcus gelatinilyticus TaxID=1702103 RepID=UPI002E140294